MRRVCVLPPLALFVVIGVRSEARADDTKTLPTEDEQLLTAAKVKTDGPALVEFLRRHSVRQADRPRLTALVRKLGDDDFAIRQQASADLMAAGQQAVPVLREALSNPDEEIKYRARECLAALEKTPSVSLAAAVARLLRERKADDAVAALLDYLPGAGDPGAEEEILITLAVLGIQHGKLDSSLAAALTEDVPLRRAAAALVAGCFGTEEQKTTVRKLLDDDDIRIRFRAAQGLLAGRDRKAVPVLISLLAEATPEPAALVEDTLLTLAGNQAPKIALGTTTADRRRCRDTWMDWWKTAADRLDWRDAEVDLPIPGTPLATRILVRQFLDSLARQNLAGFRRTTGLPFILRGEKVIEQRGELDRLLREQAQVGVPTFSISGSLSGAEFTRLLPPERPTEASLRQAEVRAVPVVVHIADRVERVAVFVRLMAGQVRVIGVGEDNRPIPIAGR